MIQAEIIADSLSPHGTRCTTFVLTMPRIVLAEFNTHRMISRNSASSRAVPFKKMVKRVKENPFVPIKWMKDHSGMQGDEYFGEEQSGRLAAEWLHARDAAVAYAEILNARGVTKQFINRLLEPFMWHTVIATATDWENFFALRAHGAAEIHIQKLAFIMLTRYNNSLPKQLKAGEWHIPFGDKFDRGRLDQLFEYEHGFDDDWSEQDIKEMFDTLKIKIATARCARVSYINYEGKDDYQADIKLHDRLVKMGHWSPFEHCAKAMNDDEYTNHFRGKLAAGCKTFQDSPMYYRGWSGNFKGFLQYRKMFNGENKRDERVQTPQLY